MAKVEFKASERLLQRRRYHEAATIDAAEHEPTAPTTVATLETNSCAAPQPGKNPKRVQPRRNTGRQQAAPDDVPADRRRSQAQVPRRTVQTAICMPIDLWHKLEHLASELADHGQSTTTNGVLIATLRQHTPEHTEHAAALVAEYLRRPPEQRSAGEPIEERNVRLPAQLRERLDRHRRVLATVGRDFARSNLISAALTLHGPRNIDDAIALLTDLRDADVRAALDAAGA
jgi:hypothetical protein